MDKFTRMQKRNKPLSLKAFTLVETMVTLAIFCLIFTLPTVNLKSYQDTIRIHNTRRQFKAIIENYSRIAVLKNRPYTIQNSPQEHYISVSYGDWRKYYEYDKNVKVSIPNGNKMRISKEGRFAPLGISFSSNDKKENLNIQMLWGRLIDAKD